MYKQPCENCIGEVIFQEQVTYLQPPEFFLSIPSLNVA